MIINYTNIFLKKHKETRKPLNVYIYIYKGKVIPLQTRCGREGG